MKTKALLIIICCAFLFTAGSITAARVLPLKKETGREMIREADKALLKKTARKLRKIIMDIQG